MSGAYMSCDSFRFVVVSVNPVEDVARNNLYIGLQLDLGGRA